MCIHFLTFVFSYITNYSTQNLFSEIVGTKEDWSPMDPQYILSYLPSMKLSVNVSRLKLKQVKGQTYRDILWKNYKLFESDTPRDGKILTQLIAT